MLRLTAVLLALGACGDNLTGIPLAELAAETTRARCERFVRCGLFTDEDTCNRFFRARPDHDLDAALAAGAVRYDGPSAEACVAALATLTCDESSREFRVAPPACAEMFAGTVRGGEACALDEECISGTCDRPACGEACCPGTCLPTRARVELDQPCTRDDDCEGDASCNEAGVCAPLGEAGALCRADRDCAYGLGCIGPSEFMAGNCRELPKLGEACPYMRCGELGARCSAGTCVALGLPGADCTRDAECSPFALCDTTTSKCIAVPELGDPCESLCAGEAYCDVEVTHACVAPIANGAPCGADNQCASLDCIQGPIFDVCGDPPRCF